MDEKLIKISGNSQLFELKESLIKKIIIVGILACLIGSIVNYSFNYPLKSVLTHGIGVLILTISLIFNKKNSYDNLSAILLFYFCFIYTPEMWFLVGGMAGAVPFCIYIISVLIIILLENTIKKLFLFSYIALSLILIFYDIRYYLFNKMLTSDFIIYILSFLVMLSVLIYTLLLFKQKYLLVNEELYKVSITDDLTGVYNYRFIERTVKNLVNKNVDFSIIIFDLDHFKKINDKYGHQEGNNVIRSLCSNIYKIIPKNSVFGRYGGDEFIIVLLDEDKQEAVELAELIRTIVEKTRFAVLERNATISVGVASSTETEKLEVLNAADKLLYKAKEKGRNRIEYIK